jgi:hypothetical protein
MTSDTATERALRALLEDDVTVLPDRVLDAIVAQLPLRRQRRRWWSSPGASRRLAVGVAALALIVAVGIAFGLRPGGVAAPRTTPTPSPSPTVTPSSIPSPSPLPSPGYGSAPPDWPTPMPVSPPSALPDPAGDPLPANLAGREYNVDPPSVRGTQAEVLTLRAADDPHCKALYEGRSTCFTILWTPNYPNHVQDPAARGSARIVDGNLVLAFDLVPNDLSCEGTSATLKVSADLSTLDGLKPGCEYRRFVAH